MQNSQQPDSVDSTAHSGSAPTVSEVVHAPLFMVFDVESIGLHGEGFAVGWIVVDREGKDRGHGLFCCDPSMASGEQKNRQWVQENIPAMSSHYMYPRQVRAAFWRTWLGWKERGAVLVADCCWPVEARFLAACVDDAGAEREWEGPYPLHDLGSVLLAIGRDPLATNERQPNELPAHHPLNDARQSARLLTDALARYAALRASHARLVEALTVIAELPTPEQDNMIAANMRALARAALSTAKEI